MNRAIFLSLLLSTAAVGADTILYPPSVNSLSLRDANYRRWPIAIAYGTDGNSVPVPLAIEATQAAMLARMTSSSAPQTITPIVALTSVQVVASNSARKGFFLWNNSANSTYCTFGSSASSASPTFIVATFTSYVYTAPVSYTGPIACIRNAGTGSISVTELL